MYIINNIKVVSICDLVRFNWWLTGRNIKCI